MLLEADPSTVHTNGNPYTPFTRVFRDLALNYRRLYLSFAALGTWLALYEQAVVILPYALVAPRLFADSSNRQLTLGQLVKVTNAFGKVFSSLNVISDSWLSINEWRSCLRRLREFEREADSRSPAAPSRLVSTTVEMAEVSISSTVVGPAAVAEDPPEAPWAPGWRE